MRLSIVCLGVLMLTGCVGNADRSKFVLSAPNDSVIVDTQTQKHEVRIDENQYLYYNDEQQFYVQADQLVVVEASSLDEPTFTLMDKNGRSFQFDISF